MAFKFTEEKRNTIKKAAEILAEMISAGIEEGDITSYSSVYLPCNFLGVRMSPAPKHESAYVPRDEYDHILKILLYLTEAGFIWVQTENEVESD